MALYYYFGRDGEDEFEYDLRYEDISDFIDSLDKAEVIAACKEYWKNESEKEKADIADSWEVTTEADWDKLAEEDYSCLKDYIFDHIDDYEDEMKEYFEKDAIEAYRDAEEYRRDPLGYYGMSQSDFI